MLAYENQVPRLTKAFICMGIEMRIACRLATIYEEYRKPNHGKWQGDT